MPDAPPVVAPIVETIGRPSVNLRNVYVAADGVPLAGVKTVNGRAGNVTLTADDITGLLSSESLSVEQAARAAADAETLASAQAATVTALAAEATARANAINSALAAETAARVAAIASEAAVRAAAITSAISNEAAARNTAITAAIDTAGTGSGVPIATINTNIATAVAAEAQLRANADNAEIAARIQAITAAIAAAKAYADSLTLGGSPTTPVSPNPNAPPATAIFDRNGSAIIGRDGNYIQFRVPAVVVPDDGTTPVTPTPAPAGAIVTRTGAAILLRDGTYLMQRTTADVIPPVVVDPEPEPETPPVQSFPATAPHLRLTSAHGNVIVESQNGTNAVVRLVRPIYQNAGLLTVTQHNTNLWRNNTFYSYRGPRDMLGVINAEPATVYDIQSTEDGQFSTQIFQGMSDGSFLELNVTFKIAPNRTGAIPAATPVPAKDTVILFEDFNPKTGSGVLSTTFGNVTNTGLGTLLLLGRASAMSPPHPEGRNVGGMGYPNGLYEFHARMIGDLGNAAGPCILLWPYSNGWPGPEVDMGEFFADGSMYMANHYKDASYPVENNQQDRKTIWPIPKAGFNPYVFNTYGARTMNTGVIFYMNGVEFARDEFSPAPKDFKNGGEDHTIGLLSGSDYSSDGSPTGLECDWIRFTPESLIGVDPGTTPIPPAEPTNPTQPNAVITAVTTTTTAPVASGTMVPYTIASTGFTRVGYVKVGAPSTGYQWLTDPVYVNTTGSVTVSIPITNSDEFLKALPDEGYDFSLAEDGPRIQVIAETVPVDPPPTNTTPLVGDINVLLRGQSNAYLFLDFGGMSRLKELLQQQTGRNVTMLGTYTGNDATIHSGTPFMTWERDGQQASLLRFVNALPAAVKARPTITLWMHNEYEQNNWELTPGPYEAAIRSDAIKVRAALGQPASKSPYLFASVRYNYGNNFSAVNNGWIALKNDPSFNASITYSTSDPDILMDGDGYPGSSHIGPADALRVAAKLAPILANIINAQ